MKTFWKITLILWGITFSTSNPEKQSSPKTCHTCLSMSKKTTQTCDAVEVARDGFTT